jgi:signal transduction histidine kinase/DNA-binding response OmpR family regulator
MKKLASLLLLFVTFSSPCQNKKLELITNELLTHPQLDTTRVNLLNAASLHVLKSKPEKSFQYAEDAAGLATQLVFPKGELQAKNNMAVYFLMKGKPETALKLAIEGIQIGERLQSPALLADSYSILGAIYHKLQSQDKAVHYLQQALELKPHNVLVTSRIYNSLGGLARDKENYDSALLYYEKAIAVMNEARDDYRMAEVLNNIGIVYLRQDKLDTGLKYFLQSSARAKETGNLRAQILSAVNIGNILIEQKKFSEAEQIELSALNVAKALGDKTQVLQVYLSLAAIKMETGKHHEAHQYMNEHYALKDSLMNAESAKQIAEIETRYETEKKDQTIRELEQSGQLQRLKQWYLVAAILTLAVVFIAFYLFQRRHQKKIVKLLDVQKILNQKLQENDALKSSFFANISHEFRTPLSLIIAPIEAKLSVPSLQAADRASFQLIKRNANRLLVLINQLLDLSKLEAKKMELVVQQGDLKDFLVVAAASFDSLAENKKINFIRNIHFDLTETWYDVDKLEKIIYNILFNAFKFTPSGGTINYSIKQVDETNDLEINITDTGKGIPEEDQQHIFSPFYQSRYEADDGQPGTGLGLSLVKEIVKLFHGEISLISTVGTGTSITITLPVTKKRLPASATFAEKKVITDKQVIKTSEIRSKQNENPVGLTEAKLQAETILVIEDNDDMRNFISGSLANKFSIVTAKDGEEGFALAIECVPDIIISDVMMPRMDGVVLSEKIRNDERTSHIPIILLTAKADKDSRIEGFQKGVDDYIAKPFSMDELVVRIHNLTEQRKRLAKKYRSVLSSSSALKELTLEEKFLLKAKEIVEEHIGDSHFSVEQMAEEINLSRSQLFRKLKAVAGISPNEFINEIRLQKAAQLILAKADTIAQIGYRVGFNEQSYFAKSFRKKFGVPPSEYILKKELQEA